MQVGTVGKLGRREIGRGLGRRANTLVSRVGKRAWPAWPWDSVRPMMGRVFSIVRHGERAAHFGDRGSKRKKSLKLIER
jgi:hypothetical protein